MKIKSVVVHCSIKRSHQFQSVDAAADVHVELEEDETYQDALRAVYPTLSRQLNSAAHRRLDILLGKAPDNWGVKD